MKLIIGITLTLMTLLSIWFFVDMILHGYTNIMIHFIRSLIILLTYIGDLTYIIYNTWQTRKI